MRDMMVAKHITMFVTTMAITNVMSMTPMARFGVPEEIANTALFLASEESSYFSGQSLFPNGGMYVG